MNKLDCPMRLTFGAIALFVWLGILLTGFGNVHWFMYLPAIGLTFVAATGICMAPKFLGKLCKN